MSIRNDLESPSLKNNMETPTVQTTLTGWVLASTDTGTPPLDGSTEAKDRQSIIHNNREIEDARHTQMQHLTHDPNTNIEFNYSKDTVNAIGLNTIDNAGINNIGTGCTH